MKEKTLSELLALGESDYAKRTANILVVEVQMEGQLPEIIINPRANFEAKFAYYAKAYNEDLTLKANPKIRIVHFDLAYDTEEYFL